MTVLNSSSISYSAHDASSYRFARVVDRAIIERDVLDRCITTYCGKECLTAIVFKIDTADGVSLTVEGACKEFRIGAADGCVVIAFAVIDDVLGQHEGLTGKSSTCVYLMC